MLHQANIRVCFKDVKNIYRIGNNKNQSLKSCEENLMLLDEMAITLFYIEQ